MRKFLMITGAATIAILAFAQTGGKDLLGNMTKTLNSAPSLSATYMIQQIGGGKKEYTISFAKPNKMRIEKANDLIVCDGTTIVSYDKNSKVYNKRPQTDAELTTMFQDEGLSAWKSFFFARAYDKISSA